MARSQTVLTHGSSLWTKFRSFGKQMLGEPSRAHLVAISIGCIRSEYETDRPRFQRFDFISAGIMTVSNYKRKA